MSKKSGQPLAAGAADKLREELRDACKEHTKAAMRIAKGLFDVCYGTVTTAKDGEIPVALAWGHESFSEYAEHELGIHAGTARDYVLVYDELVIRRSFPDGHLPDSITKLKLLARISRRTPDARDLNRWIGKARDMSCCELENAVDAEFGERGKRKNMSFYMKWSHIKPVQKGIDEAKELFGVETNGEALAQIVGQWAEMRSRGPVKIRRAG